MVSCIVRITSWWLVGGEVNCKMYCEVAGLGWW